MKPKVGDKFKVEMLGQDYRFDAEVIAHNKNDNDREFELMITERYGKDARGKQYKMSDTFAEVELGWFTKNPKRKITPML